MPDVVPDADWECPLNGLVDVTFGHPTREINGDIVHRHCGRRSVYFVFLWRTNKVDIWNARAGRTLVDVGT
jgi:hypothetical protein